VLPVQSEDQLREVVPTPALYIYETVELELSLATVSIETEESLTDYFSCPLRLSRGSAAMFHLYLVKILCSDIQRWQLVYESVVC